MKTLRSTLIAAACAISFASPACAQSDATIDRIWRLGMDSSHVQQLSQTLFDSIGPRLTGSPGIRSASDWVISQYKAWGIDAKREQYGTWRGWRRGTSHIDLMQPRVRSLAGTMLAWSPGTNGKPVTEVQRQHRVRPVASEGEGEDRHGVTAVADVSSE
jgi:carboxypeptidase Q